MIDKRNFFGKKIKKKQHTEPFDTAKIPPKQNAFFLPFIWIGCWLQCKRAGIQIEKKNWKDFSPPFIVFGTHHSFTDFLVTPLALFPHRANYVSELEGFEAYGEWFYRQLGCLGTRKFINDMNLVRNIKRVMDRKGILVLYPEARYANVGTSSEIPLSTAKLVKMLKVPVVTINMHGNYLQSPIWNLKQRKQVQLRATLTGLYTREQVASYSVEVLQKGIVESLQYDEYKWQEEMGMKLTDTDRAEGLHLPLYQCRCCGRESCMRTKGITLFCQSCKAVWELDELGRLIPCSPQAQRGDLAGQKTEFQNTRLHTTEQKTEHQNTRLHITEQETEIRIPDWYEWQRENVIKEIQEDRYRLDCQVYVEALPNAVNFLDCGIGQLIQKNEGFSLIFTDYGEVETKTLFFPSKSLFSIHTEYDYRGKGQCVTLSTSKNTYFLFPVEKASFSATKVQFATEYLYQAAKNK